MNGLVPAGWDNRPPALSFIAATGIHGPLGEERETGTSGSWASRGRILPHEQSLDRLTQASPGTPVDVNGQAPGAPV